MEKILVGLNKILSPLKTAEELEDLFNAFKSKNIEIKMTPEEMDVYLEYENKKKNYNTDAGREVFPLCKTERDYITERISSRLKYLGKR